MPRPIHIHVEEPSMEAFLGDFLPRILSEASDWKIIDHSSKWQLLNNLPVRLLGYAKMPILHRPKVLVLVDRDDDECSMLKARLESACNNASLFSKTSPGVAGTFDVVNRIVVEELEAWYFGDVHALCEAWPGVPATLGAQARFRDPDAITGGTHEALLGVLQKAGHFRGMERLPKIDAARRMGALIDPAHNRSVSFQHFLTGLNALVATV